MASARGRARTLENPEQCLSRFLDRLLSSRNINQFIHTGKLFFQQGLYTELHGHDRRGASAARTHELDVDVVVFDEAELGAVALPVVARS